MSYLFAHLVNINLSGKKASGLNNTYSQQNNTEFRYELGQQTQQVLLPQKQSIRRSQTCLQTT